MLSNVMRALLLTLLSTGLTLPAMAQDDKRAGREREALRRAQQQVQKSTQDLSALQQKFDATEQERAKLVEQVVGAQTQAKNEAARGQRLQRDLQTAISERDALKARNADQESKLQELSAKLAQLDRDLASARQRGQQLDTQGAGLREQVAACENRNTQLYATGRSLIEQCRDRSARDTVLRLEPFSGMGRVGIENMLETQRDKLDEQKSPARLPAN